LGAPKDWVGQDAGVRGDFTVVPAGTSSGNIRTRLPSSNTGGGDVVARHVYAGGSPGGFHILNTSAANDYSLMPDGSPASNITAKTNSDGVLVYTINIALGTFAVESLIADIDAGVTFGDGSPNSGVALAVGAEARSMANMDFTILGWQLVTDVAQPLRLQVLRRPYATYDNATWDDVSGTSTSTGGMPRIGVGGGVKATASDIHLWPITTLSRGDVIRAVITNNTGANGWYSLQLYGRRNVKKT
jgi:hypothetical protein